MFSTIFGKLEEPGLFTTTLTWKLYGEKKQAWTLRLPLLQVQASHNWYEGWS